MDARVEIRELRENDEDVVKHLVFDDILIKLSQPFANKLIKCRSFLAGYFALFAVQVGIDLILGRETEVLHGQELLLAARHLLDLFGLRPGLLHDGADLLRLRGAPRAQPAPAPPHVLRHSHATALQHVGVSSGFIQQSLHHESLRTTETYLHSDLTSLRRELSRLPRLSKTTISTRDGS